jgi:DNA-binding MarR family transcriptional regulator
MQAASLNRGGFDLLMGIRAQSGLTGREMRERLAMTVPTFARLLGELDQRGLISKTRSQKDARAQLLYLSVAGAQLSDPIARAMRDALREAYRAAGAEHVTGARAVLEAIVSGGESD